jgi:hypothetical protein
MIARGWTSTRLTQHFHWPRCWILCCPIDLRLEIASAKGQLSQTSEETLLPDGEARALALEPDEIQTNAFHIDVRTQNRRTPKSKAVFLSNDPLWCRGRIFAQFYATY